MALVVKDQRYVPAGVPVVLSATHTKKASATVPATTTQNIFTIGGGRVLVFALLGEVTTAIQNQLCNLKVTAVPTTGTAYDVAADLAIANDEVGTLYSVEGDGTALLTVSSGAITTAIGQGFVVSAGTLRIETSATNTGATKWDIWWMPLDEGAYVISA